MEADVSSGTLPEITLENQRKASVVTASNAMFVRWMSTVDVLKAWYAGCEFAVMLNNLDADLKFTCMDHI